MLNPTSETVILAALRSGDIKRALELLLDRYQDQLYTYCARLVGRRDATRIYGQILTSAVNDLTQLDRSASIRAWLFTLAREAITHHHQVRLAEFPGALDPLYVPVKGPAEERALFSAKVSSTIERMELLEPTTREVLQLSLWHHLRLVEVAHVTERTEAAVRTIAASGLMLLASAGALNQTSPS
jgi:DNA-directed RNA polymerase specialized sigma24 family protein